MMLKAALEYAKRGLPVFPCIEIGPDGTIKTPYITGGFKNASTDETKIKKWWKAHPNALIGTPTGLTFWALDVDLPDGPNAWLDLKEQHGEPPETRKQQTRNGGFQFFFKMPENVNIRNSTSKIGKQVDTRGIGGYVILPPSIVTETFPNGTSKTGSYSWANNLSAVFAPEWLINLVATKPESEECPKQKKAMPNYGGLTSYIQKALSDEMLRVASASNHTRNTTLNSSAFNLGQLVGGNQIDRSTVESALLGCALSAGLKEKESRATIKSGLDSGIKEPRYAKEQVKHDEWGLDALDESCKQESADVSRNQQTPNLVSRCKPNASSCKQDASFCKQTASGGVSAETRQSVNSLASKVSDWITNSTGSFTTAQLDQEFCLFTRLDKNNRARVLNILNKRHIIKKDIQKKGLWHVIDTNVDWIDLNNVSEESFPLVLPFGLHELVNVPPKGIILIAGATNAGKTSWILNTLRLNMTQSYGRIYLMSEGGPQEYKQRVAAFGDDIGFWNNGVKSASKLTGFDGIIQHHNPDGLNCIDYLEEVDGEYYKIPSAIRSIYDSLGDGVAIVAIQKKKDADYGRGGEATSEKARLYLACDYLATREHSIVCALKVIKAKHYLKKNINNHEIHFEITRGVQMEQITDWMPCVDVNREYYKKKYSGDFTGDNKKHEDTEIFIKTDDGKDHRIVEKNILEWQKTFKNINVRAELNRLSTVSYTKPILKAKGWFYQLPQLLAKANLKLEVFENDENLKTGIQIGDNVIPINRT